MDSCKLPLELCEAITDAVIDKCETCHPVALPAAHRTTRTLLALGRTCKSLRRRSSYQLYRHCLYIDSAHKLKALCASLSRDRESHGQIAQRRQAQLCTSLYLCPFSSDFTINEPAVVEGIQTLFGLIGASLERLVIDMPLRSVYPQRTDDSGDDEESDRSDDSGDHEGKLTHAAAAAILRPQLRAAFQSLTNLEEFVSIRDELFLDTRYRHPREPLLWLTWHKLKRLSLYNVDLFPDSGLIPGLNALPHLREVVFVRPDHDAFSDRWEKQVRKGVKLCELDCAPEGNMNSRAPTRTDLDYSAPLLVSHGSHGNTSPVYLHKVEGRYLDIRLEHADDPISVCQGFMRYHAVSGSIWTVWQVAESRSRQPGPGQTWILGTETP